LSFKIFGKDSLREKLLCGFAVAMFSAVLMIYFCAQNTSEILPNTALILTAFILWGGVISYALSLIIFRRSFPAMMFCLVCWLGFYLSPLLYKIWLNNLHLKRGVMTSLVLCIVITAFLIAILTRKTQKTIRVTVSLIGVLAVILVMNLGTLIEAASSAKIATNNNNIPIKKDFIIDKNTKSPNIYWIHPDGMLSVNAVKKYFEKDQKEFLAELKERGFEINNGANFEACHLTTIAIPSLMNPYTYDNWITEKISSGRWDDSESIFTFLFIRMNNELQYALAAKNYELNVIGKSFFYYPIKGGRMWFADLNIISSYDEINDNWAINILNFKNPFFQYFVGRFVNYFELKFKGQNYRVQIPEEKLKEIFMNSHIDNDSTGFAMGLYDTLHGGYAEPKLTIIHDLTPHYPYFHGEDGSIIHDPENMNPLDYYTQHIYAGKVLIGVIDMILEKDPEAVIVIQADHGLHGNSEADFKKAFGDKADAKELWNSTMSALRVPPEYKTGEEHYALETPLNMTRYLVNSFVGKNYEYLQE